MTDTANNHAPAYQGEAAVIQAITSIDGAYTDLAGLTERLGEIDPIFVHQAFDALDAAKRHVDKARHALIKIDGFLRWSLDPGFASEYCAAKAGEQTEGEQTAGEDGDDGEDEDGEDEDLGPCMWIQGDGTQCDAEATGMSTGGHPHCSDHPAVLVDAASRARQPA